MKLPKKINKYYKCQILQIKKPLFKYWYVLVVLVFIGSILAQRASAQSEVRTITIIPPSVNVNLDPGGKTEGEMKIVNDSSEPLAFKVEVQDFIVVDTVGTPNFLLPNTLNKKYSAASWIGVSPNSFTVQPGQKQVLNYFIQIPQGAAPGGHYAAAVFTPGAAGPEATGSVVTGQVGTLFYIAVSGPITEKAEVTRFTADKFNEYGPVGILTQIKNFGDLHIRPKGYITVSDLLGRKAILPLKENNIFPQAARDYENQFGGSLMIGRFKAELLASYGVNNNLPLVATVYFWIFPWKIIVIVILIVIALILGSMYYRKNGLKKPFPGKKPDVKEELTSETPETK